MIIDIFPHIMPKKYREAIGKKCQPAVSQSLRARCDQFPALTDLEPRFAMMDKHQDIVQVLTLTVPFIERVAQPKDIVELVRLGNDEMAELVAKYPDRFVAAVGNLPMNDMDAALAEADRIVNELHFKGVQICTDINGKPLDLPEFMPLYEKMAKYDLPIFLHPVRPPTIPDYTTENVSKYKLSQMLGWPYDTSVAMIRLVLGQVLQKYPGIKFVTHHCGAMIPYFDRRILNFLSGSDMADYTKGLDESPLDYLKKFYADTALSGGTAGLVCGYTFFGADHIVFGTDMPLGSHGSRSTLDEVISAVERMGIKDAEKRKIFSGNAVKLMKLRI